MRALVKRSLNKSVEVQIIDLDNVPNPPEVEVPIEPVAEEVVQVVEQLSTPSSIEAIQAQLIQLALNKEAIDTLTSICLDAPKGVVKPCWGTIDEMGEDHPLFKRELFRTSDGTYSNKAALLLHSELVFVWNIAGNTVMIRAKLGSGVVIHCPTAGHELEPIVDRYTNSETLHKLMQGLLKIEEGASDAPTFFASQAKVA